MRKKIYKFTGILAVVATATLMATPVFADNVHSLNVDDVGSYENGDEITNENTFDLSDGNSSVEVTAELGSTYYVVLPNKIHLQHGEGDNWSANYKVKGKGNILDSQYIEIKPSAGTFKMTGTDTSKEITVTTTQTITTMRNQAKKTGSDALLVSASDEYTELSGKMDTTIRFSDRYTGTTSFDYGLKSDS